MKGFQDIAIPIDFSEGCAAAISSAQRVAGDGAVIRLIHVLPDLAAMHPGVTWDAIDEADRADTTRAAMRQFAEERGLRGAECFVAISHGNPANEIALFAARHKIELVVIGSHGRTGLARLAMGSVAERVARYCACPVLVVKTADVES